MGSFWLPDTPDTVSAGMLSVEDGGAIKLRLIQPLSPKFYAGKKSYDAYPVIAGKLESAGNVVLTDVEVSNVKLNQDKTISISLTPGAAIVSQDMLPAEMLECSSVEFSFDGLEEWFMVPGCFTLNNDDTQTAITHTTRPPTQYSLGNGVTLNLVDEFSGKRAMKTTENITSRNTFLRLVSDKGLPVDSFRTIMRHINYFFSFVTAEHVSLKDVSLQITTIGSNTSKPSARAKIYYPEQNFSTDHPIVSPQKSNIAIESLGEDLEIIMQTWMTLAKSVSLSLFSYFRNEDNLTPESEFIMLYYDLLRTSPTSFYTQSISR